MLAFVESVFYLNVTVARVRTAPLAGRLTLQKYPCPLLRTSIRLRMLLETTSFKMCWKGGLEVGQRITLLLIVHMENAQVCLR